MVDEVISIPEIFAPLRVTIFGTPNLDATRAVNAAYRAGVRGDRALCNAGGGLVGGGGSECYFGEAAFDKASQIVNNPDAPDGIKSNAQDWLDANPDFTGGEETDDTPSAEQGLIDKYGKAVVDDFKQKYEDIVATVGKAADDPWAAIEGLISTASGTKGPCWEGAYGGKEWIRNCVTVGVLVGIPGLPVPPIPGVVGATQ